MNPESKLYSSSMKGCREPTQSYMVVISSICDPNSAFCTNWSIYAHLATWKQLRLVPKKQWKLMCTRNLSWHMLFLKGCMWKVVYGYGQNILIAKKKGKVYDQMHIIFQLPLLCMF